MKRTRLYPAFSALGALLAFSPYHLGFLILVALIPLLLRLREPGVRPFRAGYGFGLIFGLGQLYWLAQLTTRWTGSLALGLVPWLLATLLFALYFGLAGWLSTLAWKMDRPWLIPIVWAGVEVFRSYLPVFAFPWGLIATPIAGVTPLIQGAHLGTVYLVGAWVVAFNLAIALVLAKETVKQRMPVMIGTGGLAVVSLALYLAPIPSRNFYVTVGQPGVDLAFGDPSVSDAQMGKAVDKIEQDAQQAGSQLVVLPEGLVHVGSHFPPPMPFHLSPMMPTIFGGQRGDDPAYQTAFAYDGRWTWADKTRLVIFGEFVPGRSWIPFLSSVKLPSGDLTAGDRVQALRVAGVTVGPVICFEALFPDISYRQALNGSQMLAVMSMDDWFMGTSAPEQLRTASVWRAVENGLPLVRAAETGYTLAIDPKGHVYTVAPLRVPYSLEVTAPIQDRHPAPYWLPIFPVVAVLTCLIVPIWAKLSPNASKCD
jgi:apolipoprotein N-acyltransferase